MEGSQLMGKKTTKKGRSEEIQGTHTERLALARGGTVPSLRLGAAQYLVIRRGEREAAWTGWLHLLNASSEIIST